jgi:hypothetical protein
MNPRKQLPTVPRSEITTSSRDKRRVTMGAMPRLNRRAQVTPESEHLDAVVRDFNRTEARLIELRAKLQDAVIAAVLDGKLSRAEAARRAGYSREHVSRLVTAAEEDRKAAAAALLEGDATAVLVPGSPLEVSMRAAIENSNSTGPRG